MTVKMIKKFKKKISLECINKLKSEGTGDEETSGW